jgi:hypothetical protein
MDVIGLNVIVVLRLTDIEINTGLLHWQPGDLWVLRGVVPGFWKAATTRVFVSLLFGSSGV